MNKSIIRLLVFGSIITSFSSCYKDTSTNNNLETKKKDIIAMIDSYGLSNSVQLADDFDYTMSIDEVNSILQKIKLSKQQELSHEIQYNEIVDKLKSAYDAGDIITYQRLEQELVQLDSDEISVEVQEQIELDRLERVQQGKQYLEELKYANTKEDSIKLSKLFDFTLPSEGNMITSTRIETYHELE